jgi:hypothetical protein
LFGPEQEHVSDSNLQLHANSLNVNEGEAESASPVWLQRLSLVVFVVFCIELGMLLAILPWTRVWTDNSLIIGYPQLRSVFQNNFARGVVTGLGLVDIWIGIWEAVQYKEKKTASQ